MKIYTGKGDGGMSGLFNGRQVPKNHPRLETYGTLDELNSHLGLAAAGCAHAELKGMLMALQSHVLTLGADLATPPGSTQERQISRIAAADVAGLERQIDGISERLPPLKHFILPGGGPTAARLHVARTVCRRAERQLVSLMQDGSDPAGDQALIFVNRLSDLLFELARLANHLDGIAEVEWKSA